MKKLCLLVIVFLFVLVFVLPFTVDEIKANEEIKIVEDASGGWKAYLNSDEISEDKFLRKAGYEKLADAAEEHRRKLESFRRQQLSVAVLSLGGLTLIVGGHTDNIVNVGFASLGLGAALYYGLSRRSYEKNYIMKSQAKDIAKEYNAQISNSSFLPFLKVNNNSLTLSIKTQF